MTEDPTRATARPDPPTTSQPAAQPRYGRIGPVDPRDDPITRPSILPRDLPAPTPPGGYPDPDRAARGYDPVPYESPTVRAPLPDEPLDDIATGPTPTQSGPGQTGPTQTGPTQTGPTQTGPTQTGPVPPRHPERLPDHVTTRIPTGQTTTTPIPVPRHSRVGGLWTGLIVSAVVLILLLVFVLQNLTQMPITFLFWTVNLPIGVAMLFAAIAGILLVAIPGGLRMLQLRRAARRANRIG